MVPEAVGTFQGSASWQTVVRRDELDRHGQRIWLLGIPPGGDDAQRQPVATIFSRTLLAAADDYRAAFAEGGAALQKATQCLERYGLVPEQIRDIPLNARSFIELVPLQAGAVLNETGGTGSIFGFGKKLSIAGTRYTSNSFLLDGADINDASGTSGSVAGTMAGVETVREIYREAIAERYRFYSFGDAMLLDRHA